MKLDRAERTLAAGIADAAFWAGEHPRETASRIRDGDTPDFGIEVRTPGSMGSEVAQQVHITPEIIAEAIRIWSAPGYAGEY